VPRSTPESSGKKLKGERSGITDAALSKDAQGEIVGDLGVADCLPSEGGDVVQVAAGCHGGVGEVGVATQGPYSGEEQDDCANAPFLQAAQVGVGVVCPKPRIPNPFLGNRDTRRGLQLSNVEDREGELIFGGRR
ncbi:hypothetical protein Dimus_005958, partial [Dionaea muscipula]